MDTPTEADVKEIRTRFGWIIEQAVRRKQAPIRGIRAMVYLWWDGKRFRYGEDSDPGWADRAAQTLADLLEEHGHLLKECPALAPRAEAGETCGLWFVAKRPNQEYCSATCQSRASTRAAREGKDTAATLKRREEKEG